MPEQLPALCSVLLATGAVASSALPKTAGSKAQPALSSVCALQNPAAQAPGKKAAEKKAPAGQKGQAKAEETPLGKAQALLAQIDELGQAKDPSTTIAKRVELLAGADALCDAADAAGKTPEERREAFTVRWTLADRAFKLEDWPVDVELYSDAVPYCLGSEGWGADHWFTLNAQHALAASLSSFQRSKPWNERDYKPALKIFRELVEVWDARLKSALEAPGNGPLPELFNAGEAHESLGVTLVDARQREEGIAEVLGAHALLCKNVKRLGDPSILRSICADLQSIVARRVALDLTNRTLEVLKANWPDRKELILELSVDQAAWTFNFNSGGNGTDKTLLEAMLRIRDQLPELEKTGVQPSLYCLRTLAANFQTCGRPEEALPLAQVAFDRARTSGLPATHLDRSGSLRALGLALTALGRYQEASDLYDSEPDVAWSRFGRAEVRLAAGSTEDALLDLQEALKSQESGVTDPNSWGTVDTPSLLYGCRLSMGIAYTRLNLTSQALACLEQLYSDVRRSLSSENSNVGTAAIAFNSLTYLAVAREAAGDRHGAESLCREALDLASVWESEGDLAAEWVKGALAAAKANLGGCLWSLDKFEEAEQVDRDALELARLVKRPDVVTEALVNLSEVLAATRRWSAARACLDELSGAAGALAPMDPQQIGNVRAVRGEIALGMAEPQSSVIFLREGIRAMEASQAPYLATNAHYRGKLLEALASLEDTSALRDEIAGMTLATRRSFKDCSVLSARERGEIVAGLLRQAEQVAAIRGSRPGVIDARELFEWFASLRAMGGPLEFGGSSRSSPEVKRLFDEALKARRHVAALQFEAGRSEGPAAMNLLPQAFADRDAADRALIDKLGPSNLFGWLSAKELGVVLHQQEAVGVSIHRIHALPPQQMEDRYLAFVLDRTGDPRPVDLGPAAPIEEMIRDWRKAVTQDRGRPVSKGEPDLRALGEALRAAVLDPVLKGATEKRVFLCLDDALHTIPWDALPAAPPPPPKEADPPLAKSSPPAKQGTPSDGKGGAVDPQSGGSGVTNGTPSAKVAPATARGPASPPQENRLVGDDYRIAELPSFRDLLHAAGRSTRQPALLAIGDIDYSAPGETAKQAVIAERPMRGSAEIFGPFDAMTWSAQEIDSITKSFRDTQRKEAVVLRREKATKKALFERAPSATYLHISTHGYFAPEDIPALGGTGQSPMLEAVTGFAPLSLCGLVLAGANSDVGPLEEVTGIVTAEELAGLDLSACQLAVLSGCKTDIGVRRAGQNLASLNSALHAAGARNVIASLWRVPDLETSELMSRFYEILWKEKDIPPDEALWKAKKSFRGQSPEIWAGWVFSGVPETK